MMGGNFGKFSIYTIWSVCRWYNKSHTNMEKSRRNYYFLKWSGGSIFSKSFGRIMELISTSIEPMSSIVGNSSFWNILTRYGSNRCIYRYSKFSSNIHKCPECIYLYNRNDVDRVKQPEVVFC